MDESNQQKISYQWLENLKNNYIEYLQQLDPNVVFQLDIPISIIKNKTNVSQSLIAEFHKGRKIIYAIEAIMRFLNTKKLGEKASVLFYQSFFYAVHGLYNLTRVYSKQYFFKYNLILKNTIQQLYSKGLFVIHPSCFTSVNREYLAILTNKGFEDLIKTGQKLLHEVLNTNQLSEQSITGLYEKFKIAEFQVATDFKSGVLTTYSGFAIPKSIKRYFNGEPESQYTARRRDMLVAIVAINWANFNQAANMRKEVQRGAFTTNDKGKLYNFYLEYCAYANNTTVEQLPMSFFTANDFAYRRDGQYASSHHIDDQWGIDMRFLGGGNVLEILPNSATHLLFGKKEVNNTRLSYHKLEEAGLGTLLEFFAHAVSYQNSGIIKDPSKTFREQDFPVGMKEIYFDLCKEYDVEPKTGEDLKFVYQLWAHMRFIFAKIGPAQSKRFQDKIFEIAENKNIAPEHLDNYLGCEVYLHTLVTNEEKGDIALDISYGDLKLNEGLFLEPITEEENFFGAVCTQCEKPNRAIFL